MNTQQQILDYIDNVYPDDFEKQMNYINFELSDEEFEILFELDDKNEQKELWYQ